MPLGPYKQPQAGAKIGKAVDMTELPDHRRASIGNFEEELTRRGLTPEAAEAPTVADTPAPSIEPPPIDPDETQKIERGVQTLEALSHVMEQEEPMEDPSDPIEEAAQPTEEEKQEFIRCVLGNRPYKKRYELFGGATSIEFTDLTPAAEEGIYRSLAKAELEPGQDWAVALDRMRLVASTVDTTFSDLISGDPVITVTAVDEIMRRLGSATHYRVLMQMQRIFHRHLEIMLERALDSDFWRVGGSSSPPEPLPEEPSTTEESPESEAGISSNTSSST
ncbi:MAG TPA: hypothetical protein VLT59_04295 [Steroidobacteraceae bacterium]|nr:hypothetical protein [Steroidobacteraceae bacterium]